MASTMLRPEISFYVNQWPPFWVRLMTLIYSLRAVEPSICDRGLAAIQR
ncbi:hypothetical protein P3T43_006880 [Paraburkholderia sp. GAS41]